MPAYALQLILITLGAATVNGALGYGNYSTLTASGSVGGPIEAGSLAGSMAFVYDRATDRSSLVVLEAQDVAKGPVAEVHLPVRVPYGFHASFVTL